MADDGVGPAGASRHDAPAVAVAVAVAVVPAPEPPQHVEPTGSLRRGGPALPVGPPSVPTASSRSVVLAYLALCVAWGSTYLAIRVGVRDLPTGVFAGTRFVVAGALLLGAAVVMGWGALGRRTSAPGQSGSALRRIRVSRRDLVTNAVVGILLLSAANGLVVWAEQFVASGIAAVFVVTVSLWMAVFDALVPGSASRPTPLQFVGLAIGFAGTLLLVGTDLETLRSADWRGPLALTVASAVWAAGSIYSQRRPTRSGPQINSGLQMLIGGLALLLYGTATGEWAEARWTPTGVSSVVYLIVVGSIIGFTAYVHVLRHMPATVAGTYVYVNTVVAVLLGWLLLDEPVTGATMASMGVVIGAVVWVRRAGRGGGGGGGRGRGGGGRSGDGRGGGRGDGRGPDRRRRIPAPAPDRLITIKGLA